MSTYQLAQLNIATMKAPLDSPQMAQFRDNINHVNAIAEASPGFVWRYVTPAGDESEERVFGTGRLVNVSVWQTEEALRKFAFEATHRDFLQKRSQWFERVTEASSVLWWVPAGHRPSLEEAAERMALLREHGPTSRAFGFGSRFDVPWQGAVSADFAEYFAEEWIAAWNARDLPRILAHYREDFSMSSPVIRVIAGEATGRLQGKAAVADYWRRALERLPANSFRWIATMHGIDSLVIHYHGMRGLSAELFCFDADGLVSSAVAHYEVSV